MQPRLHDSAIWNPFSFKIIIVNIVYIVLVSRVVSRRSCYEEHPYIPMMVRNANFYASNSSNNWKTNPVIECEASLIYQTLTELWYF